LKTSSFGKHLAIAGTITAIIAVCVSIYLNPPSAVRAHTLDQERLQNINQIDFAVKAYYHDHQYLPDRLDTIEAMNARQNWLDPVTHQPYEYDVMGKTTYKICADFAADSDKSTDFYTFPYHPHHKGRDCIQQDVNAQ
jgi:hypothetical protein